MQIIQYDKQQDGSNLTLQVAEIERLLQHESAWSFDGISALLDSSHNQLLLILDDSQTTTQVVVGYCLFNVLFETVEILRVGTHPSWQRQGIALKLLQYLMINLKTQQVENLLLEVRADNTPAVQLYQKLGFRQIDCRKGYYKGVNLLDNTSRIDALIMQKIL